MAINTKLPNSLVGEKMPHPKLVSLIVMLTVFASVGATSWALMNSHANPEISTQELARDVVMAYIKNSHPETGQFMKSLAWTGGRENSKLLGAETYVYQSQGWNVTIYYIVVANPVYSLTVDYSTAPNEPSMPYRVIWQGTWKNGCVTEASYVFAQ
jgi:hypothetical protein